MVLSAKTFMHNYEVSFKQTLRELHCNDCTVQIPENKKSNHLI